MNCQPPSIFFERNAVIADSVLGFDYTVRSAEQTNSLLLAVTQYLVGHHLQCSSCFVCQILSLELLCIIFDYILLVSIWFNLLYIHLGLHSLGLHPLELDPPADRVDRIQLGCAAAIQMRFR